jgi:DHA3 family macrolide efflux protein-like MFS transporter
MARLAFSRNFLLIWIGQLISSVGSGLSSFAVSIWILRTTGSTIQFAMTFVVSAIPGIIAALIAGALVDRWDRRQSMIICDFLSAMNMLALAGLSVTGHLAIWQIYVGVGLSSVFATFRSPAFFASIPLVAEQGDLPRVNGAVQSGNAIAGIVGPLLAGALISLISFGGVLIVDATTFLVSLITLVLARIPRPHPTPIEKHGGVLREAAMGWRYVRERSGLRGLLMFYVANEFVFAVASVLIAPLLLSFSSPAMVGVQYAISSGGLLLGGLALTAFGGPQKRIQGVLAFSGVAGLCLAGHGLWPSFILITATGFFFFLMLPVISASESSLWQSKVPAILQGRCFAIQLLLSHSATAIGYFLSGPLSEYVFEPLLDKGGLLTDSVGRVIGVGPGRGVGLMFILLGTFMTLVAVIAYSVPAIRHLDALANHVSNEGKAAVPEGIPRDAVADL